MVKYCRIHSVKYDDYQGSCLLCLFKAQGMKMEDIGNDPEFKKRYEITE